MRSLRRILLASLLTGLVVSCQAKPKPVVSPDARPAEITIPGEESKSDAFKKRLKMQGDPEGPKLRPPN